MSGRQVTQETRADGHVGTEEGDKRTEKIVTFKNLAIVHSCLQQATREMEALTSEAEETKAEAEYDAAMALKEGGPVHLGGWTFRHYVDKEGLDRVKQVRRVQKSRKAR